MIQVHFPWGRVTQLSFTTTTTDHDPSSLYLGLSRLPQPTTDHDPSSLYLGLSRLPQPTTDHDPSSLYLGLSRLPQPTIDHDPSSRSLGQGCPAVTFTSATTDHAPGLAQHCECDSYMIASDPQRRINGHKVHKTSHS